MPVLTGAAAICDPMTGIADFIGIKACGMADFTVCKSVLTRFVGFACVLSPGVWGVVVCKVSATAGISLTV